MKPLYHFMVARLPPPPPPPPLYKERVSYYCSELTHTLLKLHAAYQVIWRGPAQVRSRTLDAGAEPASESSAPALPSPLTLAGWLSCWGDAGVKKAGKRARCPLFNDVKEGEKVCGGCLVGHVESCY